MIRAVGGREKSIFIFCPIRLRWRPTYPTLGRSQNREFSDNSHIHGRTIWLELETALYDFAGDDQV